MSYSDSNSPRIVERRSFGCGTVIVVLVLMTLAAGIGLVLGAAAGQVSVATDSKVEERYHSLSKTATDKIAIIEIEGTIIEGDGPVKKQIDQVREDKSVKAVIVRVNSPGGTVTGSDYMYHYLVKLREERKIPIVVSMGSLAASGGYYVSMCVGDEPDTIFAEPTTWTGSIGVVIPHYDASQLADKVGIDEDSIKSHRLKLMGSPLKEMTAEERAIFQTLVDESFTGFKEIVKSGRPKFRNNPADLDKVATGQIFTADQAIQSGLVDKKGFIEEAVARAIELAKLDKDKVKVVKYHEPLGFLGAFLESNTKARRSELEIFLQMATPRAYYLFAWPGTAGK